MIEVVVAFGFLAVCCAGATWSAINIRRARKQLLRRLGDGSDTQLAEAAAVLGVSVFEVLQLLARRRLEWREGSENTGLIDETSLARELTRRSQRGPARRAIDRAWRVVKWLP